jgi:epoxyqueuosine reductase QueG
MSTFSDDEIKFYEQLKNFARQRGAALFGVAPLNKLSPAHCTLAPSTLHGLERAISIAFHLSDRILEDIIDGPTKLYFFHYQRANIFLDQLALQITDFIQRQGGEALPIPASQITDWVNQKAHVSHKHVAVLAGLGWIGRNNLLITPQFGARQRLVTVITNMPLKIDEPLPWGCGECRACLASCPAKAIKEKPQDFDHLGCFQMIKELVKKAGISQNICGLCVKACPGKQAPIFFK